VITVGDVLEMMARDLERLEMMEDQAEAQREYLDIFRRGLRFRIEEALILEEFSIMENAVFPEYLVDQEVDRIIRERFNNDRAAFLSALTAQQLPVADYRDQIRDQLIVQQLQQLEVFARVAVSPGEIQKRYEEEQDRFTEPASVQLRVITIRRVDPVTETPVRNADEVLADVTNALAEADASFADLAEAYSDDSFADEGGMWGWREPRVFLSEIRDAIEGLSPGETSGVVTTEDAYYLIRLEDRREEGTRSFDEVREEIAAELRGEEARRIRDQWINRLRRKHFVQVFEGIPDPFASR
jgi:parvulin-like peptidyl-prolyl isomerase